MAKYGENNIKGYMYDEELDCLYDLAKECDTIVEIGSWKGRSTHALLSGCNGKVFAVDHFKGSADPEEHEKYYSEVNGDNIYNEFKNNLIDFDNLVIMRTSSETASHIISNAEMIFIDGEHTAEGFKKDLDLWLPKATRIICGHDYNDKFPGIKNYVDEKFKDIEIVGSIWIKRLTNNKTI